LTLASFVIVNTTVMLIKHIITQIQHKTCCSIQTSNGLDGMTTRASCTNKKRTESNTTVFYFIFILLKTNQRSNINH